MERLPVSSSLETVDSLPEFDPGNLILVAPHDTLEGARSHVHRALSLLPESLDTIRSGVLRKRLKVGAADITTYYAVVWEQE